MKNTIIVIAIIVLASIGALVFANNAHAPIVVPSDTASSTPPTTTATTTTITSTTTPPISSSNTAILKLGQEVTVNGLRIKAVAVYEDSRCPSDVQCIWAGKVRVGLNIFLPSGWQGMELEVGQEKYIRDRSVTLDEVSPYPISTKKIADNEYRFKITVLEHLR
jgi:hypothetical protein